jgi:hypothetical protein
MAEPIHINIDLERNKALIGYSAEGDHVIPWQTEHVFSWRTSAANAVSAFQS